MDAQAGGAEGVQPWRPHSNLPLLDHRPARGSSPSFTGLVHGQQPIDGIALVAERVHRQTAIGDVAVDVVVRPIGDRVHLHDAPSDVEADDGRVGAGRRLVAPEPGEPRRLALERAGEGLDLAHGAALVGVDLPEVVRRDLRCDHAQVQVVALAHLLDVPERLREVVLRVEEHDLELGDDLRGDVDEHAVLERRGQHRAVAEGLPCPLDRRRRRLLLELRGDACEICEIRRLRLDGGHVAHSESPTSAT